MYPIYQMTPNQVTFMRVGSEDTLSEATEFARKYHGLKNEDVTLTVEVEGTRSDATLISGPAACRISS